LLVAWKIALLLLGMIKLKNMKDIVTNGSSNHGMGKICQLAVELVFLGSNTTT